VSVSTQAEALPDADVVILAVPDVAIEAVSREVIPQLKTGALVLTLIPPRRSMARSRTATTSVYFIAHPCHPSVFNWEPTSRVSRLLWRHFREAGGGLRAHERRRAILRTGVEVTRAI
jgi:hypothetical protein